MNPSPHLRSSTRGSALLTVVMLTAIMALLTASMLTYTISERRGNERNRLILRSKNMAENISLYGAEQLTTKLYRLGTAPVGVFPWTGTSRNRVYLPPSMVLDTAYTSSATAEMRAGIQTSGAYALVNDTSSPNNGLQVATALVPIIAKATATHAALGSVTAYVEQDMALALTPLFQFGMFYNMDMELYPSQAFTVTGPVHTNDRLLAHPQGSTTIAITFSDRVTAAAGVYAQADLKEVTRGANGVQDAASPGTGDVIFTHTNGTTQVSLKDSADNLWRDHKYKTATETASTLNLFKTFATTTYNGNLRTNVHGVTKLELPGIGTYKEQDDTTTPDDERSNGRQIIEPPNAKKWVWDSVAGTGSWVANVDDADTKESKLAWKCGLYIIVNPYQPINPALQNRSCTLPDGTTAWVLPNSYRCFLNTIDAAGVHTVTEVILPGQPTWGYNVGADNTAGTADDYMYANVMPNQYIANGAASPTSVGTNQVLRIPQQANAPAGTPPPVAGSFPITNPVAGTGYNRTNNNGGPTFPADLAAVASCPPADAYFFDMRRANSNRGVISLSGTTALYDRFDVAYTPRPCVKIDFDMLRFHMMVDRVVTGAQVSTGYDPRATNAAGIPTWANSIYNPAGTAASRGLGMVGPLFSTFPVAGSWTLPDPFQMYYAPAAPTSAATVTQIAADPHGYAVPASALTHASNPCAWYDGIAIYLHSIDAEIRHQTVLAGVSNPDRIDSGVRLWNGRGPLASLTTAGKTGFTFVTNDAVYIIGDYNADGIVNTTTTATGYGGYSARYADSANEKLCAVMGDAYTAISQPTWTNATSGQTGGWNDSYSVLPSSASVASWRTGANSSSTLNGNQDGVYLTTGYNPGLLPTDNTPCTVAAATTHTTKLTAVTSEVSTALLVGVVPSNHRNNELTDGFIQAWTHAASGPPAFLAPGVQGNRVNSGGANNFPRLLENWGGQSLYIRGSMVGLFESRVAMEPFTNSRCYSAPGRFWGLHENLRTANHDVPLEPIVLSNTRVGFRELTAAEYAAMKTTIEALPALP